jgi:hypothetical protein
MLKSKIIFFKNSFASPYQNSLTKNYNKSFYSIREIMLIFKDILTKIKHIKLYLRQLKKYKDKLN